MDALPPPEHPVLRDLAAKLEADRYVAEIWDARWRLATSTTDYLRSCSITAQDAAPALGVPIYSARAAEVRQTWPGFATPESWAALVRRQLPAIAADLPGGVDELRAELAPELEPAARNLTPRRPGARARGHQVRPPDHALPLHGNPDPRRRRRVPGIGLDHRPGGLRLHAVAARNE